VDWRQQRGSGHRGRTRAASDFELNGGGSSRGPGGGLRPSDGRRSDGGTAMGPERKEGGERTGGPSFFRQAGPYCLWADISFAGFILYRTGPC
jgi:hypothetical protein